MSLSERFRFWFPDSADYPAGRLFSLDLLRGADIFFLTVVHSCFVAIAHTWKVPEFLQLDHAWGVFGSFDFAQPLFLFVCGAAVPFAAARRLDASGRPTAAYWRHVAFRVFQLWACGWLIRGILTFDRTHFTPYSDTLQTIAVGFLFASLAYVVRNRALRLALPFACVALYGILLASFGDYSPKGNFARIVDERIFGAIGCRAKDFTYCLTTLAWAGIAQFGTLAADVLRSGCSHRAKLLALGGSGVLLCVIGKVLSIWIPVIRHIYTPSFVFLTLGLSLLSLAVLYFLTDIRRHRRHLGLFLLFGQNSLAAWMLTFFCHEPLVALARKFTGGLPVLVGTDRYWYVAEEIPKALFIIAALVVWRQYKMARERHEGIALEQKGGSGR